MTRVRRAPPERVDEPLRWLRSNGHDLAPLTGTDTRALLAIAACWRLYFNTDDQTSVLRAVVELLALLQAKCWRLAKALIPWAGDWSHEDPVWRALNELYASTHAQRARADVERVIVERYDQDEQAAPPSEAARYNETIAFAMAAVNDPDIAAEDLRRIRDDWRRSWPDRSPPWEPGDRDSRQCRGDNDDGSPCRRDVIPRAGLCGEHLAATVKHCKCTAHGPCPVAVDGNHPSGLCFACRKRCSQ